MSNHLAIATVTATLRSILQGFVENDVPSAVATALRPDAPTGLPETGVNIFLYQVSPSAAWRNADLPTRDRAGNVVQRPMIALDLHYLLSFHGDDGLLEPQRVLGSVVRALQASPYLSRKPIEDTIQDPVFPYLAASDLAQEVERVKFTPAPLNLEEMSKLWSILLQVPYKLSLAYLGTVVLIEANETPRRALPVRRRQIDVFPFQRPVVDRVESDGGRDEPIAFGDTVVVRGSQLAGPIERVQVGVAALQPVPDSLGISEMKVALTDPALRAGVQALQVVYATGARSNVAALVLRPVVTVDEAGVSGAEVPIDFQPPVGRAQQAILFLNELIPPASRTSRAYRFEAPADNGLTDATTEETSSVTFLISGVHPGKYLVRVQVNGAENTLDVDDSDDSSPTFEFYDGPVATIPP